MQVELLSSVLWRGVVNPGGTVLDLPAETAERLRGGPPPRDPEAPAPAPRATRRGLRVLAAGATEGWGGTHRSHN